MYLKYVDQIQNIETEAGKILDKLIELYIKILAGADSAILQTQKNVIFKMAGDACDINAIVRSVDANPYTAFCDFILNRYHLF